MKLYYAPLACSLADHIALLEAGASFEREKVNLKTKRTASGADYTNVSPKGYVPALVLDNGEILTENIAVLDWLASQYPKLAGPGDIGRTRVLEVLAFISTEVHQRFKPMWHSESENQKAQARAKISGLLQYLADGLAGDYLFGETPTVADFYLFVMLLWAERFDVDVPPPLVVLRRRIESRPAVSAAMRHEGLPSIENPAHPDNREEQRRIRAG